MLVDCTELQREVRAYAAAMALANYDILAIPPHQLSTRVLEAPSTLRSNLWRRPASGGLVFKSNAFVEQVPSLVKHLP